jgi:hypothetical protein
VGRKAAGDVRPQQTSPLPGSGALWHHGDGRNDHDQTVTPREARAWEGFAPGTVPDLTVCAESPAEKIGRTLRGGRLLPRQANSLRALPGSPQRCVGLRPVEQCPVGR